MSDPSSAFDELADNLIRCGLVSAQDVQNVLAVTHSGSQHIASEDTLVDRLQEVGKLTGYQVDAVRAKKFEDLVFGNYLILDKLGAGGMGTVYKAVHRRMKRVVAIKVLARERTRLPDQVERFQREVEAVARLSHPNIVMAHDADECELGHFLVMEYVEGRDLAVVVREHGPLALSDAVDCILQAARGLDYAHAQNIVHRDIKPANLLRDQKGTIKVADMGLARFTDAFGGREDDPSDPDTAGADHHLTMVGSIAGTVDYMSPEQGVNARKADHRADIYSLGCSLFFLLTGQVPFEGATVFEKLLARHEKPMRSLKQLRPTVPDSLDAIFQRMTTKSLTDRYQSMTDVIQDLETCELPEESPADVRLTGPVTESDATSWHVSSSIEFVELYVLLVEPSRLQSRVIGGQLQELGIPRVERVASGQEAIEMMRRARPDLVISSMHLADMTGADLVQAMQADSDLWNISFVLVSSETDYQYLEPVRQAGTASILQKPFDLTQLQRAISAAVDFLSPNFRRMQDLELQSRHVLIVDDSRPARRHVRRVLVSLGIRSIVEAADGRQAIEMLENNQFDLVVSDYNMPEVDGPALARHIRQNPIQRNLPILMITSETDPARLAEAKEAGVSAVCSKVFDPQTVCEILEKLLAKGRRP